MKATDIKLNAEYVFEGKDAQPFLPAMVRRNEITGTVVEKGLTMGKHGAVVIRLSEDALAMCREADPDFPEVDDVRARVRTRDVIESVAGRRKREAQEAQEQAEYEANEKAVLIRTGEMADAEMIGQAVQSIMYSPGGPAKDLVGELDTLIEEAQRIRSNIVEGFEGEPGDWSHGRARHLQPRVDEEAQARWMPHVQRDIHRVTNAFGKVVAAVAGYEARATEYNLLSTSGVDFEQAHAIRHPKKVAS